MRTLLRRATLALAAAGAVVDATAGTASAQPYYPAPYYRPVYVAPRVFVPYVPPVATYIAPAPVFAPRVVVVRRYRYYRW